MKFISPIPRILHEIHNKLDRFWMSELNQEGDPPPKPLILGGWNFSNDYDKKNRWDQTVTWAKENNCTHLLPDLEVDHKYFVNELSDWIPHQYSNWNEEPRKRPDDLKIESYLQNIKEKWPNILDEEFGLLTTPKEISGKKARRLVVSYEKDYLPPWGSWTNHLTKGLPSSFTELRKKVNQIITPHEVDHIDFEIIKTQANKT